MDLKSFAQFHVPALEDDEIRFNVQIAVITAALKDPERRLAYWTLGAPGHCAVRSIGVAGRAILLGNLSRSECQELARTTLASDYPGIFGVDQTAHWFAEYAATMGVPLGDAVPQRLHVLSRPPYYPAANGTSRLANVNDLPLLFEWLTSFHSEAVPRDPPPDWASIEKSLASGSYLFWAIDDQPVSVAAISRRLRYTAAIAPVYTPPQHRGRGYAGSATAAAADRLFAEGKSSVCLYTDLRNPMSNRCYAKVGFQPYCDSWHYHRVP